MMTKMATSGPWATMASACSRVSGMLKLTSSLGVGAFTPFYYAHIQKKEQGKIVFLHRFSQNSLQTAEVLRKSRFPRRKSLVFLHRLSGKAMKLSKISQNDPVLAPGCRAEAQGPSTGESSFGQHAQELGNERRAVLTRAPRSGKPTVAQRLEG
jgi:hypothetical protein